MSRLKTVSWPRTLGGPCGPTGFAPKSSVTVRWIALGVAPAPRPQPANMKANAPIRPHTTGRRSRRRAGGRARRPPKPRDPAALLLDIKDDVAHPGNELGRLPRGVDRLDVIDVPSGRQCRWQQVAEGLAIAHREELRRPTATFDKALLDA